MSKMILSEMGEKRIVKEITKLLSPNEKLLWGYGHDSAFIDLNLASDEILLMNTDRSGMNIAYKLGLADAKCVGDFAVSHAVSDVLVANGNPIALSVALLLPPDLSWEVLRDVVIGIDQAAKKYGCFIAAGDTKSNAKFAIIVTVVGKAKREQVLKRSGAEVGDHLVIVGNLGLMLAGLIAFKNNIKLTPSMQELFSKAIINQNPPYEFNLKLNKQKLAHASIDNSDGLLSSIFTLSRSSNLGILLNKNSFAISEFVCYIADQIGVVDPFQLCLGSGDWQHIYAVPDKFIDEFKHLAQVSNVPINIVGKFTQELENRIDLGDRICKLKCLENDRFGIGGTAWFDLLSHETSYYEE